MSAAVVMTASGWSGFWNLTGDMTGYVPRAATQLGSRPTGDKLIAMLFKRNKNRAINELFLTLLGAAAGSAASATHTYVDAPSGPKGTTPTVTGVSDLGGSRTISTLTDVSRNTTAADITWLSKFFDNKLLEAGISYPTPLGPGGGGKLRNGVVSF